MSTTEEIVARYRLELADLQGQVRQLEGQFAKIDTAAKQSAQKASEGFGKLGDAAKKVGLAIAGAFAVDRLIRFAFESVSAFREAEVNARKLQAAVSANGGLAADFERLVAQSAKLQGETIFSDDAVQQAQTLALQYGLNADAVERLLPLVADFASATGQDLTSALQGVLAGVSGQERALKQYGIVVDSAATKNENLASITEQLTAKFSGQAKVLRDTATGGAAALANTFDDLQERLGEQISPLLGKLADQAQRFLKSLEPTDSELLQDEINQLGALQIRLTSANTSGEDRVRIIKELQQKYPAYLGNLSAETVGNTELVTALRNVNNQLVNKLVLAKEDEKVQAKAQRVADAQARVIELEQKAAELLLQAQEKGVDLGSDRLTIEQKIQRVLQDRDLRRQATGGIAIDAETRLLRNLTDVSAGLAIANGSLRQEQAALAVTEEKRADVVKRLGLSLDLVAKKTDDTATGLESVLDGVKLEAQTVAQLEALLARARATTSPSQAEDIKKIEAALKQAREAAAKGQEAQTKKQQEEEAKRLAAQENEYKRAAGLIEQYYLEQRRAIVTNTNLTNQEVQDQLGALALDQLRELEQAAQQAGFFELIPELQLKQAEAVRAAAQEELDKAAAVWEEFLKTPLGVYLFGAGVPEQAKQITEEEFKQRRADLQAQITEQSGQLFDALYANLVESQRRAAEEQAAAETERLDAEEARLQESFDRKKISAREYEQQLAKLRAQRATGEAELQKRTLAIQRQADIVQRARSLFQIFTNTATAVTAALASGPFGVGLVPFIKALGLLQAATVLATPLPKYARGVSKVPRGKNPAGVDTVPALLTEGERVVTVAQNRKHYDVLEAIHQDRLREYQQRHVLAPALRAARGAWQAEERARWAAILPALTGAPAAGAPTGAPTAELAELWRRGVKIRNLHELAELLQPRWTSPNR